MRTKLCKWFEWLFAPYVVVCDYRSVIYVWSVKEGIAHLKECGPMAFVMERNTCQVKASRQQFRRK